MKNNTVAELDWAGIRLELVFSGNYNVMHFIVGSFFEIGHTLMAAFKAYTIWIPREKWPLINGLQMAAGGLGSATMPPDGA